jgi:hypothetical protein
MTDQLFDAALGIRAPGYLRGVAIDTGKRQTVIAVDVVEGSGLAYNGLVGPHPMHGAEIGWRSNLNFFQPACTSLGCSPGPLKPCYPVYSLQHLKSGLDPEYPDPFAMRVVVVR